MLNPDSSDVLPMLEPREVWVVQVREAMGRETKVWKGEPEAWRQAWQWQWPMEVGREVEV
jgi:hypothetical protein